MQVVGVNCLVSRSVALMIDPCLQDLAQVPSVTVFQPQLVKYCSVCLLDNVGDDVLSDSSFVRAKRRE